VAVVKTEHGRVEPLAAWGALAGHCKLRLNSLFDRLVSRFVTKAVVFVSQDIQRHARLRSSRIHRRIIYNGIAPAPISFPNGYSPRSSPGEFHIGIVGRIDKVKGHAHLLRALARLKHLPGLRLHVFGAGPLESECRRECRQAGLTDQVCFHGFQESIHEHIARLDLLVMPSVHEGLPYTLLEAMYLKVPVIASRVGGLAEVIEDDHSGVLVDARDEPALATAIERLYWSPELRSRLAQEAFRRVSRQFLAAGMVRQYVQLYAHLLSRSR
jgi:glycosyltransferase involved in cell wall biosynthesis